MSGRGRKPRWIVAFVAALAIFVQTFGAAHAAGAMPFGPVLDAFGNPLCLSSAGETGGPSHGDGKSGSFADCCTLGCASVSPALAGADAPEAGHVVRQDTGSRLIWTSVTSHPSPDRYEPSQPRAPPLQS